MWQGNSQQAFDNGLVKLQPFLPLPQLPIGTATGAGGSEVGGPNWPFLPHGAEDVCSSERGTVCERALSPEPERSALIIRCFRVASVPTGHQEASPSKVHPEKKNS